MHRHYARLKRAATLAVAAGGRKVAGEEKTGCPLLLDL